MQFNTTFSEVYSSVDISEVKRLDRKTFVPKGWTALLDALAETIQKTSDRINSILEIDRPEKVLFIILTDGEENSSREYTRKQVINMIKKQEEYCKWKFVYLGANQDAIQEGNKIGLKRGSTITIGGSGDGIKFGFNTLSKASMSFRSSSPAYDGDFFSDDDRKKQKI